jgi:curli biogenesis system outer membrane secretion channel CsgG
MTVTVEAIAIGSVLGGFQIERRARMKRECVVLMILFLFALGTWGCQTTPTAKVTSGEGPSISEAQQEAYNGPKARIAVAQFKDKTGKGWWSGQIGDGMADMLATSLFNTNRYIVLERHILSDVLAEQDLGASGRVRKETAAPIGKIEGAELLVTGAVTEFEPGSSGAGGGIGGTMGQVIGGVLGAVQKAHIAIDMRLVDTRTTRLVAAVSVEGEATNYNLGGLAVGSSVGGSLGGYSKTPMEKAVRIALGEAVKFVVSKTPQTYYHFK